MHLIDREVGASLQVWTNHRARGRKINAIADKCKRSIEKFCVTELRSPSFRGHCQVYLFKRSNDSDAWLLTASHVWQNASSKVLTTFKAKHRHKKNNSLAHALVEIMFSMHGDWITYFTCLILSFQRFHR